MSSKQTPKEDIISFHQDHIHAPSYYNVMMHNDDFTPFDFVVQLLVTVFFKNEKEAYSIAQLIHKTGTQVVGCYPLDIAETKVHKATYMARRNEFPLRCSIEPA